MNRKQIGIYSSIILVFFIVGIGIGLTQNITIVEVKAEPTPTPPPNVWGSFNATVVRVQELKSKQYFGAWAETIEVTYAYVYTFQHDGGCLDYTDYAPKDDADNVRLNSGFHQLYMIGDVVAIATLNGQAQPKISLLKAIESE